MPRTSPPAQPRLPSFLEPAGELSWERESTWEALEIRSDLSNRTLEGLDIAECRFAGARMTLTALEACRVRDSVFVDCEASGLSLDGVSLTRVEFRQCRLAGAVLSRGRLRDVRFVDCQLRDLQLRLAEGARVRFESCDMGEADLYGTKLERSDFVDCDLTHADFSQAAVQGARLHGSKVEELRGASWLSGAVISSSQAVPLALQLLATTGIVVRDEDEDEDGEHKDKIEVEGAGVNGAGVDGVER